MIIDGRAIADEILGQLGTRKASGRFLAAIFVGDDVISRSFLRQKEKCARQLGISFQLHAYTQTIDERELLEEIRRIALDERCGGLIVQLPLPKHLLRKRILDAISLKKDPDLLSGGAFEAFLSGGHPCVPPAVGVVQEIFHRVGLHHLSSLRVAVIGRGRLVGRPVSLWLQSRVADLDVLEHVRKPASVARHAIFEARRCGGRRNRIGDTVRQSRKPQPKIACRSRNEVSRHALDSRITNLSERLRNHNVIISGVGKPRLFGTRDVSPATLVIDFGYSVLEGETNDSENLLVGDFDSRNLSDASDITFTPTPGGTGPILVAKLFENFLTLNEK